MKIKTVDLVMASIFIVLYIIGAKLSIPIFEISFSLQVLFIILAAMLLNYKVSSLSVSVYILMGLAGLPVFTKGGGLQYLVNPGAGFLFGFIFATLTVGIILKLYKNKEPGIIQYAIAGLAGILIQYVVAIAYFLVVMNFFVHSQSATLENAIKILFIPFFALDCLKAVIAALIANRLKKVIK